MQNLNKKLIVNFIDTIWNEQQFSKLTEFIHVDFLDHSLPETLPPTVEGLKLWIKGTSDSFEHKTKIEEQVTEGEKSIIKIRVFLKHIGLWRGIPATGGEISTIGYRYFRISNDKIIEHWALIDGNAIDNQLRTLYDGCKIQI